MSSRIQPQRRVKIMALAFVVSTRLSPVFAGILLGALLCIMSARADVPDPAVQQIEKFHAALLGSMKQGGIEARFKKLAPAIDVAFDLAAMTKFTVGATWDAMSEDDHKSLIQAFRRMTIASYAHNFAKSDGLKFTVDPTVEARDVDRLVHGQIVPADNDKAVSLTYRMRKSGSSWKIIDVFLNGYVSQLATRRSEFASTLRDEGAAGLRQKLDQLSDDLMKE